jgi:tetratricopeptide (TPR) repeat protein
MSVETVGVSFWNEDEWPEVAYSLALSYLELKQDEKAKEIFNKLIENGKKMLEPEINPVAYTEGVENRWDRRLSMARGYYMQALGNLGLGNKKEAADLFSKSIQTEASFLSANSFIFEEMNQITK